MAANVTGLLSEFKSLHRLKDHQIHDMRDIVETVKSIEESKALNKKKGPMLIISASGMATGGRVLHHLKTFAPDPRNFIVISGYQALGTRGRLIQDGAKEVKIYGEFIPVEASVRALENVSAHADSREILKWLSQTSMSPKKVFVTHGEKSAATEMAAQISRQFGWEAVVPRQDQEFNLS
jgi:metallo-beta-lactamase family protein